MEKYLGSCLDSVLNQTLKDIEIICINDGSEDSSLDILKEYKRNNNNIVIIDKINEGAGVARNVGIRASGGEYIAFMDADDFYYTENALEILYNKAKDTAADMVGGGLVSYFEGVIRESPSKYRGGSVFDKEGYISFLDYQYIYGFTRFIYRLSLLKNSGIYFPNYNRGEDPPFMLSAMLKAKSIYSIKEIVYCARYVDKRVMFENKKVIKGVLEQYKDILRISSKNRLAKLHVETVYEMLEQWAVYVYKQILLGNLNILDDIEEINNLIDDSIFKVFDRNCVAPKLLQESEIDDYIRQKETYIKQFDAAIVSYDEILIYGAGNKGKSVYDYLKYKMPDKKVKFVVTKLSDKETLARGQQIHEIEESSGAENAIVIITTPYDSRPRIKEKLLQLNFKNFVEVDPEAVILFCS